MKTEQKQNSFEIALAALDANSVDAEAAKALQLCNRIDEIVAERDELAEALRSVVHDLAMWPGENNPEFFPSMKKARAVLAKIGETK